MTEEQKQEETKQEAPKTLLDEVRAERENLERARNEAKAEADRLEKLKADELLSGTAGLRDEKQEIKKELSNKDYMKKVVSGEIYNDRG